MFGIMLVLLSVSGGQITPFQLYPYPPTGAQMVCDSNGLCYVFSGEGEYFFSNMLILDITSLYTKNTTSFSISNSNVYPSDRRMYGMFLLSSVIYIFGGVGLEGISNDLWAYDIPTDSWTEIKQSSFISARFDFASQVMTDISSFIIVGGMGQNGVVLSDAWKFSITDMKWSELPNYDSCTGLPLYGGQLQYSSPFLYLFSGLNFNNTYTYFGSICRLKISQTSWTLFKPDTPLEFSHGGSYMMGNNLYFFLGVKFSDSLRLYNNDLFSINILKLGTANWKRLYTINSTYLCESFAFAFSEYINFTLVYGGMQNGSPSAALIYVDQQSYYPFPYVLNPNPRIGATLSQVGDSFFLFGGRDQNNFYTDIWMLSVDPYSWEIVTISGSRPGPRVGHAASAFGSYILYVGGTDIFGEFLAEYWLFDTDSKKFLEITPSQDGEIPEPVTQTCVILDNTEFYMIGGRTESGLNSNIWKADIQTSIFTKIGSIANEGFYKHGCALFGYEEQNKILCTFFGSETLDDIPYCKINEFALNNTNAVLTSNVTNFTNNFYCRTDSVYIIMNQTLIVIGGQANQQEVFNDVYIIELGKTKREFYLPNILSIPLYSSVGNSIGNNFYTFSGLSSYGYSIETPSIYYMYAISVRLQNIGCGNGYVLIESTNNCTMCLEGTYSSSVDSDCINCPIGTFSQRIAASDISQCLFCPYGQYNDLEGASTCKNCTSTSNCRVGSSINYLGQYNESYYSDSQPKIYKPQNASVLVFYISIAFLILIALTIAFFIAHLKFQVWVSVYEIFKENHVEINKKNTDPEEIEVEPKAKVSYYGGICTIIAIVAVLFELCIYITLFAVGNRGETRSLVPIDSLIQEYSFSNIPLEVIITMNSYRGKCNSSGISLNHNKGITATLISNTFPSEGSCQMTLEIQKDDIFQTGDYLSINFKKFTSDMQVALSAKSGIPGEISRATDKLLSEENNVFIGGVASIFSFNLSPAILEDKSYLQSTTDKGYRVSLSSPAIQGSTFNYQNILNNAGFIVQINFIKSTSGVTVFRFIKVDWPTFIGSTVGAIAGLLGLFAFLAYWTEWGYYFITKKERSTEKKDIALQEYADRLEKKRLSKKEKEAPRSESSDRLYVSVNT